MFITLEWALFFSYLGLLVGFVLAFILIPRIIKQQRAPGSALAWLLVVLFFPYVGVFLYVLVGGRKMQRLALKKTHLHFIHPEGRVCSNQAHPLERLLLDYNLPAAQSGNQIHFLTTGTTRYQELIEAIDSAQEHIHILMYIFQPDEIGRELVTRLAQCAARGVKVRLLLDKLGSRLATRRFLSPLLKAGGELAFFLPEWYRSNLRNHRKMVIIDDRLVLSGGANLGGEYLSRHHRKKTWADLSYVLQGPTVSTFAEVFRTDWEFASHKLLILRNRIASEQPTSKKSTARGRVQAVPSGPDVEGDTLYDCMMTAIFSSQKRLWLVTPYFVPDEALLQALRLAAMRCVDVRILLPWKSDHRLTDLARWTYIRELQAAGAKVLFYQSGMLHAKALLQDGHTAIVGTANFDMRSLFLNYEIALCLYDPKPVKDLETWFLELAAQSKSRTSKRTYANELSEGFIRLLSPLL